MERASRLRRTAMSCVGNRLDPLPIVSCGRGGRATAGRVAELTSPPGDTVPSRGRGFATSSQGGLPAPPFAITPASPRRISGQTVVDHAADVGLRTAARIDTSSPERWGWEVEAHDPRSWAARALDLVSAFTRLALAAFARGSGSGRKRCPWPERCWRAQAARGSCRGSRTLATRRSRSRRIEMISPSSISRS